MNAGKALFAQVMEFVPRTSFARIVQRHGGNSGVRAVSCAEHFRAMALAQLTWRESLRDIEASLSANASKLYAMGFRSAVRRSTLADANESRDRRIWSDLAALLIWRARKLQVSESALGVALGNTVYALDSSTIDLCLSLFAWVPFRSTKAAIKLHTLLDLRGAIPAFFHISDGKLHDVNVLDMLAFEAGAFYVMDRGYVDFARLSALHQAGAFFVTLEADVASMLRRILFSMSGDGRGGVATVIEPGKGFLDTTQDPPQLPAWLNPDDLAHVVGELQRTSFRGGMNWYRAIRLSWGPTAAGRGGATHQPSHFIGGDRDDVLKFPNARAAMERFDRTLPGLRGSHILPGAGHWIQREKADADNALVLDFLKGLLAQPSCALLGNINPREPTQFWAVEVEIDTKNDRPRRVRQEGF